MGFVCENRMDTYLIFFFYYLHCLLPISLCGDPPSRIVSVVRFDMIKDTIFPMMQQQKVTGDSAKNMKMCFNYCKAAEECGALFLKENTCNLVAKSTVEEKQQEVGINSYMVVDLNNPSGGDS